MIKTTKLHHANQKTVLLENHVNRGLPKISVVKVKVLSYAPEP